MSERLTEEQQRIVEENIRLAYMMARKYRPPYGMDFEDWEAECLMQLAHAVRWHDPAKGMLSTILDRLIFNTRGKINSRNRRSKRGYGFRTVSSDSRKRSSDCSLGDFLKTEHDWQQIENRDLCEQIVRFLDARELQAVSILAEGCTQREIGKRLGVSRQRVNELIMRSREKLADRFPDCLVPWGSCVQCGKPRQRYSNTIASYCTACSEARRDMRVSLSKKKNNKRKAACA